MTVFTYHVPQSNPPVTVGVLEMRAHGLARFVGIAALDGTIDFLVIGAITVERVLHHFQLRIGGLFRCQRRHLAELDQIVGLLRLNGKRKLFGIQKVGGGGLEHGRSDALSHADEAQGLERLDRFANAGPADSQLPDQLVFGRQLLARFDIAALNQADDESIAYGLLGPKRISAIVLDIGAAAGLT
jgi:hypothetical protein